MSSVPSNDSGRPNVHAEPHSGDLEDWVGRCQTRIETISAEACNRLASTLDHERTLLEGDKLAPLWHLIAHLPVEPLSRLGRDGHALKGDFLPPVSLPRRMWVGGRFGFVREIRVGDTVTKFSTIESVTMKRGRTGELCFVTVAHELSVNGEVCITEEQDLVFRQHPKPDTAVELTAAPTTADWTRTITPSPVMLFRYSALTFNSHRIHYDREYATATEGYDGLVFHGPLTATLLADLATAETGLNLAGLSVRALAPLYGDEPFTISGSLEPKPGAGSAPSATLWAATPAGGLAMRGRASFK